MTHVRTLTSAEVARAIRNAFRRAASCHCETVGKLGEGELMDHLIAHAVIEPQDASGIAALEIAALNRYTRRDLLTNNAQWALNQADVRSLNDLRDWTFADLLKLTDISMASAKRIESVMAKYGLLLKGGDPALLEEHRMQPEPVSTGPLPDGTPEEIRARTARALFEIASKITRDGASLTRIAALIIPNSERGDGRRKGQLKNYIKLGQASAADVARVAAPVFAIEALEKERPSKGSSKRPSKAPAAEPVLRLVGVA